ncbi:Crp/Fnr family transcriptional regulator [soil metagenome]
MAKQVNIDDKLIIIRRNDFLARLNQEDYEALNLVHNYIIADKNAYIYFDAQQHNKLYFVKEGYVRIGNIDDQGNELVKDILHPGDVFGQLTLEKNNMHGEFAQAHKTETILCAFTIEDFQTLLQRRTDLALQFSKKIGQKVRRIENRLLNLLQRDVRSRLLYFFWSLMPEHEGPVATSHFIENYFTHEDIARLTGTSRQTVTTLLNQFADEGILEVNRDTISILDIRLLQLGAKVV